MEDANINEVSSYPLRVKISAKYDYSSIFIGLFRIILALDWSNFGFA